MNYKVTGNVPGGGAPSGNVTVTDGARSCTGTVDAGQCAITFTTAGAKSLTATYAGDDLYAASPVSAAVSHQVNRAATTSTITSDDPDPSVVGQAVTVMYSVAADAPGGGTPTGNVTVSDGTDSCTGTVAAGQCAITLTTAGSRSLTATYAGDANYNASPASAVVIAPGRPRRHHEHDHVRRPGPVGGGPGGDREVQRRGQRAGRRHADRQRDGQRRHRRRARRPWPPDSARWR